MFSLPLGHFREQDTGLLKLYLFLLNNFRRMNYNMMKVILILTVRNSYKICILAINVKIINRRYFLRNSFRIQILHVSVRIWWPLRDIRPVSPWSSWLLLLLLVFRLFLFPFLFGLPVLFPPGRAGQGEGEGGRRALHGQRAVISLRHAISYHAAGKLLLYHTYNTLSQCWAHYAGQIWFPVQ